MRIGVLSATVQPPLNAPDITGTIVGGGQGSAPPTTTYGLDVNGNTLICPPGYPYDPGTQDCLGYVGSPGDTARTILQADIDACISAGGTWVNGQCVIPSTSPSTPALSPAPAPVSTQLISGINNGVLYAAGALLLLMTFMGARR